MKKRKLGIIGGSGLYKMEGFEKLNGKKFNTLGENHQMKFYCKTRKRGNHVLFQDILEAIKSILRI